MLKNLSIFLLLILFIGCSDDTESPEEVQPIAATVVTNMPTTVGETFALVEGNVIESGSAEITQIGILYSESSNPTFNDFFVTAETGLGEFEVLIENLTRSTTYYYKSFAINGDGLLAFGDELSFLTNASLPQVFTNDVTQTELDSAKLTGDVIDDGGDLLIEKGVCWSTSLNPTIENNKSIDLSISDKIEVEALGLTSGTTYYARAYAINRQGINYGNSKFFTTL
jgi:hypothetical protein